MLRLHDSDGILNDAERAENLERFGADCQVTFLACRVQ